MHKSNRYLQWPVLFVLLLPVFFLLHNFAQYYFVFPLKEGLQLAAVYIPGVLLLLWLTNLLYKDYHKAALLTFAIAALYLLFGVMHDLLKKNYRNTFISTYSFLLPFFAFFLLSLAIYLKKTKKKIEPITRFLNLLFFILILFDGIVLVVKIREAVPKPENNLSASFIPPETEKTPDVYLIILDEYAGHKELQDLFHFDNTPFENQLKERGFHVISNTISNYNYTEYSMASLLNMNYLDNRSGLDVNIQDKFYCRDLINNNNTINFFAHNNYTIHGLSFFQFNEKQFLTNSYTRSKKMLYNSQTLPFRLNMDLGHNFRSAATVELILKDYLYYNNKVDSLARNVIRQDPERKKFIYAHFFAPHFPYYFDSLGKEQPLKTFYDPYKSDRTAYISYLQYTNKKIVSLVDEIKKTSLRPVVIMLLGDHGFRQFNDNTSEAYHFMNINAVFLPNGDYSGFYEGMSNVNQFRVLLNNQFGQKLPLLKDSTSFIWE